MKKILNISKKTGILFWITGLSGSGKTSIALKIKNFVTKKYGPTVVLSGDDLRKVFEFNKYSRKDRLFYASAYSRFCRKITSQKINVIFATVSLFNTIRKWNRSNIKNYIEIYIKSDLDEIIRLRKKKFYSKNNKNIVGKNIKSEFPKNPDFIVNNNFQKSINYLSKELIKKINKKISVK